jgi:Mrp family chromosome partitioning ATPase/capsular polysaccharide biosynthesis protein
MSETLRSYLVVLRRWWRIVAAVPLIFLTAAAIYLVQKPAEYQSTAVLFVSTPRDDSQTSYRGDAYSKERMASYTVLSQSPEIAQRVINDVGLKTDPATLVAGTKLAPIPETVLLALTTTSESPQQAQAVGVAYVEELRRSIAALEAVPGALIPRAELITVQPPTFSDAPGGYPAWKILGVAGGLGLVLGALAAVTISLLDGRVRRPEDAAEATGTPVLAEFASSVPWEELAAQPWASESGRQLRTPLDRLAILGSRVIIVASAEAGAGKTGVALTISRALADRGSSVALVDFDSRGSRLASALTLGDPKTVRGLVDEGGHTDADTADGNGRHHHPPSTVVVDDLPPPNWNGVAVIPFGAPEDNPGSTADDPRVASLFEALRSRYEWVVVDTPAAAEASDAVRLAHNSDAVLLIAKAGHTPFDDLRRTSDELTRAGAQITGVVFVDEARTATPKRAPERVPVGQA